eukprot:3720143-Rhodomonas_salina.1
MKQNGGFGGEAVLTRIGWLKPQAGKARNADPSQRFRTLSEGLETPPEQNHTDGKALLEVGVRQLNAETSFGTLTPSFARPSCFAPDHDQWFLSSAPPSISSQLSYLSLQTHVAPPTSHSPSLFETPPSR